MRGKEGGKNEKTTLCKTWLFHAFSWFAHTGLCVTPVGGKEGGKNEKTTLCKTWLFHAFSWFAHTGLYVTPVGGKEGSKNEKNTLCKTWFFRGLPIRASMSPLADDFFRFLTERMHISSHFVNIPQISDVFWLAWVNFNEDLCFL